MLPGKQSGVDLVNDTETPEYIVNPVCFCGGVGLICKH